MSDKTTHQEKKKEPIEKKDRKKFRILAAGDFHGDSNLAKKLAEKAYKEKVDLVILTGDITGPIPSENLIKPFVDKKQKVVFVPGNWDSSETANFLSSLYGVKDIGERYVIYDNVGVIGIGNPDWQMELNEKKVINRLKRDFEKVNSKNLEKTILVSHLHAKGTKSEFSGIEGERSLRKAIEKFKPDLFISGHIHEAEGLYERIGKTRVISVGRKGSIIEL